MKRSLRSLLGFALAIPVVALCLLAWDAWSFGGQRSELQRCAATAPASAGRVLDVLRRLVQADMPSGVLRHQVARALFLDHHVVYGANIWRSLRIAGWGVFSRLHLSDTTLADYWIARSFGACQTYALLTATRVYGRELRELSTSELAALVAMSKAPTRLTPDTALNRERAQQLLQRAGLAAPPVR